MSIDASRRPSEPEPTLWFLLPATILMIVVVGAFSGYVLSGVRQVVGYTFAGLAGWQRAQQLVLADHATAWGLFYGFLALGLGVCIGLCRRRWWAALAAEVFWFASLPTVGLLLYAGFGGAGRCFVGAGLMVQAGCATLLVAVTLLPVLIWLQALVHIRRARRRW